MGFFSKRRKAKKNERKSVRIAPSQEQRDSIREELEGLQLTDQEAYFAQETLRDLIAGQTWCSGGKEYSVSARNGGRFGIAETYVGSTRVFCDGKDIAERLAHLAKMRIEDINRSGIVPFR